MRRLAKCCALVSPGPHAIFLILSCDDAKNERFDMKQIVTAVFGKKRFTLINRNSSIVPSLDAIKSSMDVFKCILLFIFQVSKP